MSIFAEEHKHIGKKKDERACVKEWEEDKSICIKKWKEKEGVSTEEEDKSACTEEKLERRRIG